MNALMAKLLDWLVIQHSSLTRPADAIDRSPRLEEAVQFLKRPDFIPTDYRPAMVQFNGPLDFRFPTPRPCEFAENNIVHGRFYRCGVRWQERPVVILLHGSADGFNYNFRFPLIARQCNQAGFNAAALMAPYNLQRRPRQFRGMRGYWDCLQFAQATAQALAEIRALTGWLLAEGCSAVALWGYSQGAWYAGMTACFDVRLASVVLASPAGRLIPWVEQYALLPSERRRLFAARERCDALNLTAVNLTRTLPVIPKNNILLIEGIHELICPKGHIEDLWRSWGKPDIWRLLHGHIGVCFGLVPRLTARVVQWLSPRLNKLTVTDQRAEIS